ncbi:hypothetical protein B0J11DRAFT_613205 [Dendryphion nanum]|uniref:Uncharacterized protein n=1 Tax=Dendryphion nanum TaxID=256645 RepID=A0A9P9ITQ6_9PLEO|nr:hypothetical protein B0J11DRAFT_613205 [Dendryphion nanum]
MPTFFDTHNPSILAIPVFHILSVLPHSYALFVASPNGVSTWDNRNPRSTTLRSKLQDKLDPERFAYYERLKACHANGMENLPLFATAVILGNLGGLGRGTMTRFAAAIIAIRLAYTATYATTNTQGPTVIRSGLWVVQVALCFRTLIKAAKALGGGRVGY